MNPDLPPLLARPGRHLSAPKETLADRLALLLERAVSAERVAAGPLRFPAYRLTRHLLAGVRFAGYSDTAIAERLGVSLETVRTRGASDGWVTGPDFAAVAGIDLADIEHWRAEGRLPTGTVFDGLRYYPASELVIALDHSTSAADNAPDPEIGGTP